jgi:glycosyltransferase involved in cell wall biosynthesis
MNIDISVIVPTFRRPGPLVEAVRSALGQHGVTLEVSVRDDSPERSGRSVIDTFADERVRYSAHEPPTGGRPAKVRNAGIAEARGRFFHFLDDDDRVFPGAYRKLADALDANPNVGFAFGTVSTFGADEAAVREEQKFFDRARRRALRSRGLRPLLLAQLLFGETLLVNSAGLIRAECARAIGGYDESLSTFEDVEFYVRALSRFGAVFIDEPVLARRVGPSLVHDLGSAEPIRATYERMQRSFRDGEGMVRLLALKLAARTLLRWT